MPELPTIGEYLKGFEASSWVAIFVPAGTPTDVIVRLHTEITKVMARKDVYEQLMALGYEPLTSTPEQLADLLKQDTARWANVIKSAAITAE